MVEFDESGVAFEATAAEPVAEVPDGLGVVRAKLGRLQREFLAGFHVAKDHRHVGKVETAFGFAF